MSANNGDSAQTPTPPASDNSNNTNENGAGRGNRRGDRDRHRRPGRGHDRNSRRNTPLAVAGAEASIMTLGTTSERQNQNFATFKNGLVQYILSSSKFKHPEDMVPAVKEGIDPVQKIAPTLPTIESVMIESGIRPLSYPEGATEDEKKTVDLRNSMLEKSCDRLLDKRIDLYAKRIDTAKNNMAILWGTIMGQCTDSLREQLKADKDYDKEVANFNAIWLLKTVKKTIAGVTGQSNPYHVVHKAMKQLYSLKQQPNESVEAYRRRFQERCDAVGMLHGVIFDTTLMEKVETSRGNNLTSNEIAERYLAMMMLMNACQERYKGLWKDLENNVSLGLDRYPTTTADTVHLLTHWQGDRERSTTRQQNHENSRNQDQFSFLANHSTREPLLCVEITENKHPDGGVKGRDGSYNNSVTCYNCLHKGHYAHNCPAPRQGMFLFYQTRQYSAAAYSFIQSNDYISPTLIIIDTGSTLNSFCYRPLLKGIGECVEVTSYSNGGSMDYEEDGIVKLFPALRGYINEAGLVNILSFAKVSEYYRIIVDTEKCDDIVVQLDQEFIVFRKLGNGLYGYDPIEDKVKHQLPHTLSLFSTVAANKELYSRAEIEGAEASRVLQGRTGWPSDANFKKALSTPGSLYNSHINADDVTRASDIMGGSAMELIKGKTVRRKKKVFANMPRVDIPAPILEKHKHDDLDIDFMHVHGVPFLITLSRKIRFQTLQSFTRVSKVIKRGRTTRVTYRRPKKDIVVGLNKVRNKYNERGIEIDTIYGDNEFEKVKDEIIGAVVECCAANEHVHRIERRIRVNKERNRCYWINLPYHKAPRLMVVENMFDINFWINQYPNKDAITREYSPGAVVVAQRPVNVETLTVTFGAYCEVYDETTNDGKERTTSAIALRPCNNEGGYYFMSLETGRRIRGHQWTELAIPQWVIDRVAELAEEENAPDLDEDGCPVFQIDVDVPLPANFEEDYEIDDGEEDNPNDELELESIEEPDLISETEDDNVSIHSVDSNDDGTDGNDIEDDENDDDVASDVEDEGEEVTDDIQGSRSDAESEVVGLRSDEEEEIIGSPEGEVQEQRSGHGDNVEEQEQRSESGRPSRSRRPPTSYEPSMEGKSYGFMMLDKPLGFNTTRSLYSKAVNATFNQMHASQGVKKFGEKAVAAMLREYKQLDDLCVFGRVIYESLTEEQKKRALSAINLIKEKRCGKIKGRTCANGKQERPFVSKQESSSSTLSLEALMALVMIFGHEKRDVKVFDVPGAYLHTDLPGDKFALMKFEGQFVDIMCDVNPEYKEDVRYENGKKVLYVQILKAIYGMIESALLWYNLYWSVLEKEGFKLNPYDKCVANKIVNGKQATIAWYVDDNMLAHVDPEVTNSIVAAVEKEFPGLVVQSGKKLEFLGINFEFRDDGKVDIDTIKFWKDMIAEFEEETGITLTREYKTPAGLGLNKVRKDSPSLDTKHADWYRKYVAKTLWGEKRSKPDLEPTMGFLQTRVHSPSKDDWHKLLRMMCFIKTTADDKRTIGADHLCHMLTMIDSAHAVHDDMRGHTGALTTFGTGVIDQKSSKQKMNTRSSTESEHVGTSEYLPKNIFFEQFMKGQGFTLKSNTIAKDNQSEIKLLKNGCDSCTWNSKHIAIKYFWVTDKIKSEEIDIQYCPTEEMLADFYSKPVQGSLFQKFRRVIMGWDHISTLFNNYIRPEERVEKKGINAKIELARSKRAREVESRKIMTYAEAARKFTENTMSDIKDHLIKFN